MHARPVATILALVLLPLPAAAGPFDKRIYPAPTAPLSLDGLPAATAKVAVTTADGLRLDGLAVPARGKPTLLIFHGNGSSAADAVRWFAPLIAQGYGVVAAEYRGYSGNPGKPDEAGLAADADAFFALARATAGGTPVWVVGHSLGGGVAFGLARRAKLDALVTIGTFTRLRAAAPKIARAMIPDAYRTIDAVAALDEPWYLIHGTADETISIKEGETLHIAAGAARKDGASFVILGADHHPSGDVLAAIFAAIARRLAGDGDAATGLPAAVKLVPFGQTAPINP